MSLAKYAEELRNRAAKAADSLFDSPTHPTILKSRSLKGRTPNGPDPVRAAAKQAKALERQKEKQRRSVERSQTDSKKQEEKLRAKALELMKQMYPEVVKQNERLIKQMALLNDMLAKQKALIEKLSRAPHVD